LEYALKNKYWKLLLSFFLILFVISACTGQGLAATDTQDVDPSGTAANQNSGNPRLWMDPALPLAVSGPLMAQSAIQPSEVRENANLFIEVEKDGNVISDLGSITWVYALEAPFPTVIDQIDLNTLKDFWNGAVVTDLPFDTILVSDETLKVFEELWGASDMSRVVAVDEDNFATNDFSQMRTWAIVPFEQISPRWKVIKLDGISPLDKPMDVEDYGLTVRFVFTAESGNEDLTAAAQYLLTLLPATNRDESKMTVLMMTGVTALVRAIAYKMEIKGLDYPIEEVKGWFENADVIHISNEVSFNADCPYPDAYQQGLRFCSAPKYVQTLQDLGVDVVEMTGNHVNDYGAEYFAQTIETYKANGWKYFGGGINDTEARKPVTMEANGNKIAFIGCNTEGPSQAWALEDRPGAAKCDMQYFTSEIARLKSEGYVVVATFQTAEIYTAYVFSGYPAEDFDASALAGADIVSGSQAHTPMSFRFVGNSLLHYGLGNFLFDTMTYEGIGEKIRREFIDRHIIYDGEYINTELLTAKLVDWSQPNPMNEQDRVDFLTDMLENGDW
jgi:poly-gamma-glutamate synthesis protein (capsule biosynthesis protein)